MDKEEVYANVYNSMADAMLGVTVKEAEPVKPVRRMAYYDVEMLKILDTTGMRDSKLAQQFKKSIEMRYNQTKGGEQ